jgi:hypothetical protein
MVVDLAIIYEVNCPILAARRLMAVLHIDDTKPTMA